MKNELSLSFLFARATGIWLLTNILGTIGLVIMLASQGKLSNGAFGDIPGVYSLAILISGFLSSPAILLTFGNLVLIRKMQKKPDRVTYTLISTLVSCVCIAFIFALTFGDGDNELMLLLLPYSITAFIASFVVGWPVIIGPDEDEENYDSMTLNS